MDDGTIDGDFFLYDVDLVEKGEKLLFIQEKIIELSKNIDIEQNIGGGWRAEGGEEAGVLARALVARCGGNWGVYTSEVDEYKDFAILGTIEFLDMDYNGVNWIIFKF